MTTTEPLTAQAECIEMNCGWRGQLLAVAICPRCNSRQVRRREENGESAAVSGESNGNGRALANSKEDEALLLELRRSIGQLRAHALQLFGAHASWNARLAESDLIHDFIDAALANRKPSGEASRAALDAITRRRTETA